MTDNNKMTVSILEMSGAVGAMKASQLARLIEGYIRTNHEIDEAVKKKQEDETK